MHPVSLHVASKLEHVTTSCDLKEGMVVLCASLDPSTQNRTQKIYKYGGKASV